MASACFSTLNSSMAASTKTTAAPAMAMASSPARAEVALSSASSSCSIGRRPCPRLQYIPSSSPSQHRSLPSSPYISFSFRSKLFKAAAVPVSEDISTDEEEIQDSLAKNGDSNEAGGGEEAAESPFPEGPKLYVGNLPWNFTSQEVAEVFQKVAAVDMVEVMYDRGTGRSRGFGFVTMSSMEDANLAVEKLDGADCDGRTIKVNFPIKNREPLSSSRPRFGTSNANKLFVGNLAWTMDTAKLEEAFSEHGQVIDARVLLDRETGRSRGFGFVTMASEAEMNEALSKMNGVELEGRSLRVGLAGERPTA